jgi:hypothetical protein
MKDVDWTGNGRDLSTLDFKCLEERECCLKLPSFRTISMLLNHPFFNRS